MKSNSISHFVRLASGLLLIASLLAVAQPALAQASAPQTSDALILPATGSRTPVVRSTAPVTSPGAEPAPTRSTYPAAVEAARAALAARLGVEAASIKVVSYKFVYWRDSCLGVYRPNEGCLTVITPGYLVILDYNGTRYEAHTDLTGKNIRWAPATQ